MGFMILKEREMEEKFSLQLNDFQANAVNSFSKLRTSSDFKDVTLVGDDLKLISAHKVILSSCSEYFKSILTQHDHSHPLICLNGVNSEDIEKVLDFIYTGALQIFQNELDRFLQISQKLKLEGLLGYYHNQEEPEYKILNTAAPSFGKKSVVNKVKTLSQKIESNEKLIEFYSVDFLNIEELELKLSENVQKVDNGNKCIICGKFFKKPAHAREHVEMTHVEGLQFPCSFCNKICRNRHALRLHKNSMHKSCVTIDV